MTLANPERRPPGHRRSGGGGRGGSGRAGGVLRQVWWASMPVWSIGFLSFAPFLAVAIIRRRARDWAVFAGYLAATVVLIVLLGAVGSNNGSSGAAVGGFIIVLAGCAAVHAAMLFRPARALPYVLAGTREAPPGNKDIEAQARDRMEQRKHARHLAETNPAMARELKIGRPDLPRQYDDGGLVDVNHVPATVLRGALGLTPPEADDVLAARDKLGRISSADELGAYTQLTPDRVDELRDLMMFG